jgi:predicted ATPase/class 3 adenylate cyclase
MSPRRSGSELPAGTLTFLFTDIEGSTLLVQALGRDGWQPILDAHNRILRGTIEAAGGVEVGTEGDAFFAVFPIASSAVAAAVAAQRALAEEAWPHHEPLRVRMGMHTGDGVVGGDDYVGVDVHRAARIAAAGHGGQVLLSKATFELVRGDGLPEGVALRDMGEHRLKDLAHPERIFQLAIDGLPAEFPPIRTLETPTNLPVERTSFVGREAAVDRIRELLRGPGLLTLTGPGGSGKTRLALRAASGLLDAYPAGVFFVDLAPVADPDLVASTIASAIGVRAEGRRSVADTLVEHLRHAEMLLIADNFEQVTEAGSLVARMLDAAPRLRVLATSREPLRIAGEQELPVPPLEVPEPGARRPESYDSVALFVQRASSVDPSFRLIEEDSEVVAEICRRLDGLPLAIELAASRTRLLTPTQILERLDRRLDLLTGGPRDLPPRQRTLRGAISWSHDLLEDQEGALFQKLSVFSGGWTLSSAEAVAGAGHGPGELLDTLASLVDKSLVFRVPDATAEARFGMLATIREFGAERLEEAGEAAFLRVKHAAFFLSWAETAEPHLRGVDRKRYLDELAREHDNLRAALRWAIQEQRGDTGLRLVGALWRFWHLRGHLAEARRWIEEVLALPDSAERTSERGKALTALGGVAYWQEDLPVTRRAYEEALDIARELGDRHAVAEGTYNLSYPPAYEGRMEEAVARLKEARGLYEDLGVRRGIADTTWLLSIVARLEGQVAEARRLAEEALSLHRAEGDRFGMTDALHVLGRIELAGGDLEQAVGRFLEALAHDEEVGNRTGMGIVLDNLAAEASLRGKHLRALRLGGASEVIKATAGGHAPPPLIDLPDPREAARPVLGDAAVSAAWEEGRSMTLEQAIGLAREEA